MRQQAKAKAVRNEVKRQSVTQGRDPATINYSSHQLINHFPAKDKSSYLSVSELEPEKLQNDEGMDNTLFDSKKIKITDD